MPVFDMIWFNNYGLEQYIQMQISKLELVHHLALVLIQLMSMGESHCALQLRNKMEDLEKFLKCTKNY